MAIRRDSIQVLRGGDRRVTIHDIMLLSSRFDQEF